MMKITSILRTIPSRWVWTCDRYGPPLFCNSKYVHAKKVTCYRRSSDVSTSSKNLHLNPLYLHQRSFSEPLFPESQIIFSPTQEDIDRAQHFFVPSSRHIIRYLRGAYHPEDLPVHKKPEVAFLGRSNVGKSSLIRVLLQGAHKDVKVRISKKPGHTKLVNFFEVGEAFVLVDMPGYGFRQPENFEHTAEGYLKNQKNLTMAFLLVDCFVGFKPWDYVAMEMLNEFGIPFTFVITKSDKAGKRYWYKTLMSVRETIDKNVNICLPQPFIVSSIKSTGIPFFKTFIAHITGNLEVR